jgi:hypothetical protein
LHLRSGIHNLPTDSLLIGSLLAVLLADSLLAGGLPANNLYWLVVYRLNNLLAGGLPANNLLAGGLPANNLLAGGLWSTG